MRGIEEVHSSPRRRYVEGLRCPPLRMLARLIEHDGGEESKRNLMTMEEKTKATRKAKRKFTFIDLFAGCGGLDGGGGR